MIKSLFIFFVTIFLVGCGGGGEDEDSSSSSFSGNFPNDNYSGTTYSLWDYTVPSNDSSTISSSSINSTSYNARFRSLDENTVEEDPQNAQNEKVIYEKKDDCICISFYKDGTKKFQYNLKRSAQVGEETTQSASSCMLVNHFPSKELGGTVYSDVIQINCGKHKGYYAKGKGEVFKE